MSYYYALLAQLSAAAAAPIVTRFLFAGEAGQAGNTAGRLADFSGNGRHFEQDYGPAQPQLITDAYGRPAYKMNPGGVGTSWLGPIANEGTEAMTIYQAYDFSENTAPMYLFDGRDDVANNNHTLLLGAGNEELFYSLTGGAGTQYAGTLLPTGRHVFTWVINTAISRAALYVDGILWVDDFIIGPAVPVTRARIGGDFNYPSYAFTTGNFYATKVARGVDSPAVRIAEIDGLYQRHFAGLSCPGVLRAGTYTQDHPAVRMDSQPKRAVVLLSATGEPQATNGATWVREISPVYENGAAGYSLYAGDGYAFWFYGTGFTLRGARLANGCPIAVRVDGGAPVAGSCFGDRTVGLYAPAVTGLPLGYHFVQVVNTNAQGDNSQVNICNTILITG